MFSASFRNNSTLARFLAGFLLVALVVFSSPAPIVLAQDAGDGGTSSSNTDGGSNAGPGDNTGGDNTPSGDDDDDGGKPGPQLGDDDDGNVRPSDDDDDDSAAGDADKTDAPTDDGASTDDDDDTSGDGNNAKQEESTSNDEETGGEAKPLTTTNASSSPTTKASSTPQGGDDDDSSTGGEQPGTDGADGGDGTDADKASTTPKTTGSNDGADGIPAADVATTTVATSTKATSTTPTGETAAGDTIIDTGDATATGGVVNQTNTNITNVENGGSGGGGGLLNDGDDDDAQKASPSDQLHDHEHEHFEHDEAHEHLPHLTASTTIINENAATTTNDASITAESGENNASSTGNSLIKTGTAESFGYLVSLFNIVVTNSSGLFLFLQNPLGSALDLTNQFMGVFGNDEEDDDGSLCSFFGCGVINSTISLLTENVANIYNKLHVAAGSGDNHASSTQAALIDTGFTRAFGSIFNLGNIQIAHSRYLVLLLNNEGDLDGNIILPPPSFFENLSTSATLHGDTEVTTDNTADVENYGTTTAETGDNAATGDWTEIDTGDAATKSFLYNDINSNQIGGSPVCFIVSVGGKWNGTVIGLPDGFARQSTPIGEIICGAGKGTHSHDIPANFKSETKNYVKVLNEAIVEATSGGNSAVGDIAAIRTGDSEAILQIINVLNKNIIGQDWIFSLTTISGDFNGNLMFGSQEFWDSINKKIKIKGPVALRRGDAEIEIEKYASETEITASSTVDYTVIIRNKGDPAYRSTFVDIIYDPSGKAIHREEWTLDTIKADEEITITYSVFFNASTTPGTYANVAFIKGIERHPSIETHLGRKIDSPIATARVTILGETLEEAEPRSCEQYLHDYLRFGEFNDPSEVAKLQTFLRDREGLTIDVTGYFDEDTLNAVHAFQSRRSTSILSPWGITASTGYVYYTTRKAINEAMCEGAELFPLTPEQQAEIDRFKARYDEYIREGLSEDEILEELKEVGTEEPTVQLANLDASSDARSDEERILAAVGSAGVEDEGSTIWSWIKSSLLDLFAWVAQPFGILYASAFER